MVISEYQLSLVYLLILATVTTDSQPNVRLAGGNHPHLGRVEIFHDDEWGSVCDHDWDTSGGEVVCNELGYGGVRQIYTGGGFANVSVRVWVYQIDCYGYENSVEDCVIDWSGETYCNHNDDAGVSCYTIPPIQNILRQRSNVFAGYSKVLEIMHDGQWGLICANSWNDNDANVACHMLGKVYSYSWTTVVFDSSKIRWMKNVQCATGYEKNIDECDHDGWRSYTCSQVVYVDCVNAEYSGQACSGRVCDESLQYCCPGIDYTFCCAAMTPSVSTATLPSAGNGTQRPLPTWKWSTRSSEPSTSKTPTDSADNGWWIALTCCIVFVASLIFFFLFYRECKKSRVVGDADSIEMDSPQPPANPHYGSPNTTAAWSNTEGGSSNVAPPPPYTTRRE